MFPLNHPARNAVLALLMLGALLGTPAAGADWRGLLDTLSGRDSQTAKAGSAAAAALSNSELVGGLRQALGQGVRNAVAQLGREDGFLGNTAVRIPLPSHLQTVERALRAVGKGDVADAFVTSLNRAAEQAVPATGEILANAVEHMSVDDARAIVEGGDTAATDYLRRTSHATLGARVQPLVDEAVRKVGVTAHYQALLDRAGPLAAMVDRDKLDLSNYVTEQTLSGLYGVIGEEERRIRENPAARTTDLLRRVFAR